MTSFFNFFKEVRAELSKVIWPSRKDTIKYTLLVVLFSVAVSVILGATDLGFNKAFEFFLSKKF